MTDVATLGLRIETYDMDNASNKLKTLSGAAARAEAAMQGLGSASSAQAAMTLRAANATRSRAEAAVAAARAESSQANAVLAAARATGTATAAEVASHRSKAAMASAALAAAKAERDKATAAQLAARTTLQAVTASERAAKAMQAEGAAAGAAASKVELMARAANQNVAAMSSASSKAGYQSRLVAMQLSQVAQQASVTGDWVRSLAIQLPDLTLGFGAFGIAVGVAAGALLPLIANMLTTSSGVKGLSSDIVRLASEAASLDGVASAISELESLQKKYAEAIVNSGKAQASATSLILANTEAEFNAKKSLLELELKRQQAAIAMQKAELASTGNKLREAVSAGVYTRDDSEARGYSDPRIGQFVRNPNTEGILSKTREIIESSGLADKITEVRAQIALTEASTSTLENALKTTFGGGVKNAAALAEAYEKANKAGKDSAYASAVRSIAEQTKELRSQTEAQAGLNPLINDYGYAQAKAKAATELLLAAERDKMAITPTLTAQIAAQADAYAKAVVEQNKQTEATKKAQEAMEFAKSTMGGFINDLRDGLRNGESFWSAFGNAAMRVLDRITDKLLNEVLDAVFKVSSAGSGSGGGLLGFLGSLFGGGSSFAALPAIGPVPTPRPFADGGRVFGAGSGTSDSILARLSNGEFVVNAKATQRWLPLLEAINDNTASARAANLMTFSDGGLASRLPGGEAGPELVMEKKAA